MTSLPLSQQPQHLQITSRQQSPRSGVGDQRQRRRSGGGAVAGPGRHCSPACLATAVVVVHRLINAIPLPPPPLLLLAARR